MKGAGGTFTGSTVGGTSVLTGSCGGFPSLERTFQWMPSTSGTATISTCTGTTFDTILFMTQGGCTGREVAQACSDDACGTQSSISPTVVAGQTYTIVVDGFSGGDQGDFTLTVTPAP